MRSQHQKQRNQTQVTIFKVVGFAFATFAMQTIVLAKTDIIGKQKQLQENVQASKSNLSQYEGNLRVLNQNILEVKKAIKTLEAQSLSLGKQQDKGSADQKSLDQIRNQIEGFISQEQSLKDLELQQINELKATLARLEQNQLKRNENLAAYQAQLAQLGGDGAKVQTRAAVVQDLQLQLKTKTTEAELELKNLIAKKSEYEAEVEKWKKQLRISERAAQNFSKLKSP